MPARLRLVWDRDWMINRLLVPANVRECPAEVADNVGQERTTEHRAEDFKAMAGAQHAQV